LRLLGKRQGIFVTRAMREVGFISPVFVGDVVSFYTQVFGEGRTSVTVEVTVEAERSRESRRFINVTQAEVIYVAVDEAGNPIPVR
jgi:acyl-CoA thioesterase YciA